MRGNSRDDLNHSNRPVRTRMPGGVGGVAGVTRSPYPDFGPERDSWRCVEYPGLVMARGLERY